VLLGKLVAVVVGVVLATGLSSAPANAVPTTTLFENQAPGGWCLDYRADYGPYVFGCNNGDYQRWHWDDDVEVTALRQVATRLCLTLRNDQLTMKPCAAADTAATWFITNWSSSSGALIQNYVSRKCLARNSQNLVTTAPCTGGPSQRWSRWDAWT
jgi:hypothetical protein